MRTNRVYADAALFSKPRVPINEEMAVDWDAFDLDGLAAAVRSHGSGPDAERMIWAFEEGLRVARLDPELLSYLLAALACLVARLEECSPRDVLEAFFRRSIPDEEWRARYLPLFG